MPVLATGTGLDDYAIRQSSGANDPNPTSESVSRSGRTTSVNHDSN